MRDISKRIFSSQQKVELEGMEGEFRGIISSFSEGKAAYRQTERLKTGALSIPLYSYIGDCTELCVGMRLRVGDKAYQVLSAEPLTAGNLIIGMKAVMEREDDLDKEDN